MTGIHPSPLLYVVQPFKVTETVFQYACEFLSIKDILTAATSCRQLHEWIWKMITCSADNLSLSAHKIARNLQCVQASVLFSKLALAIPQDRNLPFTANTRQSVDLAPILTELEKKAGRKIVGCIMILYSGYLYPVECEKKEADEKSGASSHPSNQTAITVTTGGLVTLWKKLPSADLSAKDVVHHVNIIPDKYRDNSPTVRTIYRFQHILLAQISIVAEEESFVVSWDLSRKDTAGEFASLVYQNSLGQEVVLEQTRDTIFWPGHTENIFFIGHNKEKEKSTLSSFYFDRQQGILKLLWTADAHPDPNHQISIWGNLTSNNGFVVVPIVSGEHRKSYGMSVMCARTGKTLHFINVKDSKFWFGHTENTFFIGHNKKKKKSTLSSFYFDRQQGKLKLLWRADTHPDPNHQISIDGNLMSNNEFVVVPNVSGEHSNGMSVICARTGKTLRFINLFNRYLPNSDPRSARWLLGSIIAYQMPNVGMLSLVNIFGKSLPGIELFGRVTSVIHDIQLVRKKKTYNVKTNQKVTQEEREVIDPIAIMTINYHKFIRVCKGFDMTYDDYSDETSQLVLRSDELQSDDVVYV